MFVCWKSGVFPLDPCANLCSPTRRHRAGCRGVRVPADGRTSCHQEGWGHLRCNFLVLLPRSQEKDHEGRGSSSVSSWHRPGACGRPEVLSSLQAGRRAGGLCMHKHEPNLN